MEGYLKAATGFGIAVVAFVIIVVLLQNLQTANGVTVNSIAYNVTGDGLTFADNFSSQWGLAGTILGFVLILGIIGFVAYAGYQKVRGGR